MFAPLTIFLDLETTGLSPAMDGITEVGLVILREGAPVVEWSRLVRPPRPIPPEIAHLTGITNDMVRDAPVFDAIAPELAKLLNGALMVAHNARFDYAFLKQAFARAGTAFFAPTLCTARLARELDPGIESAGLDALVLRYGLEQSDRHRALGDARLAMSLAHTLLQRHPADAVADAVRRVLRRPSLPKHLPVDALVRIPESPGVYLFHGLNQHPLYIGKAKNLRERIGAHFSGDWGSDRGARLSEELRRIEFIETSGELSALLLEAELVRTRLPSRNIAQRRRTESVLLRLDDASRTVHYDPASAESAERPSYGPYSSRRTARASLQQLADAHGLCLKVLGLERRRKAEPEGTACFAYQVRRCAGACCGDESPASHWARLRDAIADQMIPPWPVAGAIELIERDPRTGRETLHRVRNWRLEGAAEFDPAVFRILRPYVEGRKRSPHVTIRSAHP